MKRKKVKTNVIAIITARELAYGHSSSTSPTPKQFN
jgi:hypothetical protein